MKNIKELLPSRELSPKIERDPSVFAHYCRLTSELIERPYMQTFKLIQTWQEHTIIRIYNDALRAKEPQKAWWGMRKRLNAEAVPQKVKSIANPS